MSAKQVTVLISGKAGVGKSTLAKYLNDALTIRFNSKIYSAINPLAKGVKDVAYSMGWDGVKDEKGRALLHFIGQTGRSYDKDIWVRQVAGVVGEMTYHAHAPHAHPIVSFSDDWRFPNELEYMTERADMFGKVMAVRMVADRGAGEGITESTAAEISETALDLWGAPMYNWSIPNNDDGVTQFSGILEQLVTLLQSTDDNIKDIGY